MLPSRYQPTFERMLQTVASAAAEPDVPLVPFWPIRGAQFDNGLLVIGRSVNGWVESWTPRQLLDPDTRRTAAESTRANAEPTAGCRMRWVTDLWGAREGYNTNRSAFWRVLRRIVLADQASSVDADHWSSRLAWTNLYKVSPAACWNPGADLQRAQREDAIQLLKLELDDFAPRRVLALTGNWIDPFVAGLELSLETRSGLVDGLGHVNGRAWVVAKHPMKKPEQTLIDQVLRAFADLGSPIG